MEKRKIFISISTKKTLEVFKAALDIEFTLTDKSGSDDAYTLLCYEYPMPSAVIIGGNKPLETLGKIKSNPRFMNLPVLVVFERGDKEKLTPDALTESIYNTASSTDIMLKVNLLLSQREEKLKQNEVKIMEDKAQWHEKILHNVGCGVMIFKKALPIPTVVYFNDTVCKYLGMTYLECSRFFNEGTALFGVCEDDTQELCRFVTEYMDGHTEKNDCIFRSRSSTKGYSWIRLSFNRSGSRVNGLYYIGTLVDVTKEIETTRELKHKADFDSLTGIYNSSSFFRETQQMLQDDPNQDYILERYNVENFKLINDLFGVKTGDTILRRLAKNIAEQTKGLGTYGYLGNDHFARCFPAKFFDESVLENKIGNRAYMRTQLGLDVKLNVGIYEIKNHDLSVVHICDRAKLAVQTIKGNARKCYAFYTDEMRQKLIREQEITNEMQTALDNREFVVFLQPIYSSATLAPVYAEALVRWKHPVKGLVSPGEFIPIFEKNGFIAKLDYYVWEEVCRYLKQRRDTGKPPLPISVNVSRTSLYNPFLADDILELMKRYEIDSSLLKIEITESAFNNCEQLIQRTAERLKNSGLNVLIDDFGSGYSSLNTLKDLTADVLKIDMKFMGGFETSQKAGNILTSVIRMAKWLNMPVVAEGVETKTQLEFLRSIGCDYIQGFYFSKPLPIDEFEMNIAIGEDAVKKDMALGKDMAEELDQIFDDNHIYNAINDLGGSVGFYELTDNGLEVIRVNDAYYDLFGYTPSSFAQSAKDICKTFASQEDVNAILLACKEAIATKAAVRVQVKRYAQNGTLLYIDAKIRYRGGGKNGRAFVITHSDATERKMTEIATSAKLEILSTFSKMLSQQRGYDRNVNFVLRSVIDYYGSQNAYIYSLDLEKMTVMKLFEQCMDGSGVQNICYDSSLINDLNYWLESFKKNEFVFIEDVSRLPDFRIKERKILESTSAKSVLVVPMLENGTPIGFIGVSNPTKNTYDAPFLITVSNCIAGEATKQRTEKDLHLGAVSLKTIANLLAEALVIYTESEYGVKPNYSTERSKTLLKTDNSRIYIEDIEEAIDAEDRASFTAAYEEFIVYKKRTSLDCRVNAKWLSFTFLPLSEEAETKTFAVFAIDITEKKRREHENEKNRISETLFGFYDKVYAIDTELNTISLLKTVHDDTALIGSNMMLNKTLAMWGKCIVGDSDKEKFAKLLENGGKDIDDSMLPWRITYRLKGKDISFVVKFFRLGGGTLLLCLKIEKEKRKDDDSERYRIAAQKSDSVILEWAFVDKSFYFDEKYKSYKIFSEEPFKVLKTVFAPEIFSDAQHNEATIPLMLQSGEKSWCNVSRIDIKDEAGELRRVIVVIKDITERKRIEDERDDAYRRLRAIVENENLAVCNFKNISDGMVRILFCNQNFMHIFGRQLPEGEMSTDGIIDVTFEADRERIIECYKKISNGEPDDLDCRFLKPDGSIVTAHLKFSVLPLSEQEETLMVVATDISGERRVTQDVQGVLNTISSAFAIMSLNGHGKCCCKFINENLCALLGESADVISDNVSKNAYHYTCEEDLTRTKIAFMRAAIERGSICEVIRVKRSDGLIIKARLDAQIILNHQGDLVCYLSATEVK